MLDVLAAMRTVCREAREEAKVKRSFIANRVDRSDQTVGGFETGKRNPTLDLFEEMLDAYAEASGQTTDDLWVAAFERAASDGFDPGTAVDEAVAAAERAGRSVANQQRSGRAPSRSQNRDSRRQARK